MWHGFGFIHIRLLIRTTHLKKRRIWKIKYSTSLLKVKASNIKVGLPPSDKINDNSQPASFHVVIQDTSFGYLSLNNCKWTVNEQRPTELVEAIGKEIEKKYNL